MFYKLRKYSYYCILILYRPILILLVSALKLGKNNQLLEIDKEDTNTLILITREFFTLM